jgi:hypothetical protein
VVCNRRATPEKQKKSAQPERRWRFWLSGFVACSAQVISDMFVARVLPSSENRSRATWLCTAKGS